MIQWRCLLVKVFLCLLSVNTKIQNGENVQYLDLIIMTKVDSDDYDDDSAERSDVCLICGFSKDQRISSHSCHNRIMNIVMMMMMVMKKIDTIVIAFS